MSGAIPDMDLEVVYVDDGSTDATLELLRGLQREDARARVLALSRNFGQEIALTAGLRHVGGDVVAVMDADLQDPPELVPQMLERWRQGADVVYGVRTSRHGETWLKTRSADAFYKLLTAVSGVPIPNAGNFQVMDRRVADAIAAMPERHRYLRGLIAWSGFRQEPFPFQRLARSAGHTKYSFAKQAALAEDALSTHAGSPLRLTAGLGCAVTGLAAAGIVFVALRGLVSGEWLEASAALAIAMLFLGGIVLVSLGLLGVLAERIYLEVKRRPLYLIKDQTSAPAAPERDALAPAPRPSEAAAAKERGERPP